MLRGALKKVFPLKAVYALAALLLSVAAQPAGPAELVRDEATRSHETYRVSVEVVVDASPARVQRWLADYEGLHRLNSGILESDVLERQGDREALVRIVTRACFAFFCTTTTQVQEFVERHGRLHATILPERSDYKSGSVQWRFMPEGDRTRVHLDVELEPDFWIPPLLGIYLIKKGVRNQALETLQSIERLAVD